MKSVFRGKHDKGFTLMELLMVVAILAILVVIAIPIFSGSKERANAAVDNSNLRAAYAAASTAVIIEEDVEGAIYNADGGFATCVVKGMKAAYDQKTKIGKADIKPWQKNATVKVTVYKDGHATIEKQ